MNFFTLLLAVFALSAIVSHVVVMVFDKPLNKVFHRKEAITPDLIKYTMGYVKQWKSKWVFHSIIRENLFFGKLKNDKLDEDGNHIKGKTLVPQPKPPVEEEAAGVPNPAATATAGTTPRPGGE